MKTAFNVLNADELAETGSRGGMDVAATAQAADSAKPGIPIFSDNSSSSYGDNLADNDQNDEFDRLTCNTQMFNFNLNAMKVSTPCKELINTRPLSEEELNNSRKQLFAKTEILSTILEETKSDYG